LINENEELFHLFSFLHVLELGCGISPAISETNAFIQRAEKRSPACAFFFRFEWFMAFASIRDFMIMISGNMRQRECGGANRERQQMLWAGRAANRGEIRRAGALYFQ